LRVPGQRLGQSQLSGGRDTVHGGQVADVARREHLGLRFEVGSMTDLRLTDTSVAVLVAWYWRLKTQGYGGYPMKVYVHRRQPAQVATWLEDSGFTVEAHMTLSSPESAPVEVAQPGFPGVGRWP
jgi:hypothetical protein